MIRMPYQKITFNTVVDVFSGYCMNAQEFFLYIDEAARVSAPRGALILLRTLEELRRIQKLRTGSEGRREYI